MNEESDDSLNFIDTWLISFFKILPTDERFLNLYQEQKEALYDNLNLLPDINLISNAFMRNVEKTSILKKSDDEIFPKKAKKRLTEIFKSQGMDKNEIKKRLKDHVERLRNIELKNLEKKYNG